ncbi:retrotransposable element Tf2 protein type 1 [Trichonephila clavipes]|nr:retrotransposable element Tf2 protein type 1 [Trichonephila clavipes]
MIIQGRINSKQVDVLLDTGSRERESVNIIPKNIISQIKGYHNVEYIKTKIATINGEIEEADFKVGDLVMYEEFQYPNTRKLSPPYSDPYTVLRKCSDVLFEIDRPNALNKTDTELVHSVRLRHFHPSENFHS